MFFPSPRILEVDEHVPETQISSDQVQINFNQAWLGPTILITHSIPVRWGITDDMSFPTVLDPLTAHVSCPSGLYVVSMTLCSRISRVDVKLKTAPESSKAVVFICGRIAFGYFAGAGGEFGAEGFPSVCFFLFCWDNENNHMEFNWEMLKFVTRRELEFKTWCFGSCPSSLVTAWEQTVCLHFNNVTFCDSLASPCGIIIQLQALCQAQGDSLLEKVAQDPLDERERTSVLSIISKTAGGTKCYAGKARTEWAIDLKKQNKPTALSLRRLSRCDY